jgi:hypothetical protein
MNAFIENKSLCLSVLFKACVPLSNYIDFKQFEGTEPMIFKLRKAVTPEVFVSPLCCAIIFGASNDQGTACSWRPRKCAWLHLGLAPFHIAVMADSLLKFSIALKVMVQA